MNWITNYVRPTLRALVGQKNDTPENLWTKCSSCEQMIFQKDLEKNLHVCDSCQYHLYMPIKERLKALYDEGQYDVIEVPDVVADPLKFKDSKKYTDRLKTYRQKTQEKDALSIAYGHIGGKRVVTAVFNFQFMGGSMGMAVGEGLIKAAQTAVQKKAGFLVVPASGGARMQEGILSLMQLPRSIIAVEMVREATLPYVVLLTHPTTGGVSASFAMMGDVTLSEPGATIGFAGRRVIEETIREALPDDFQTAEYLEDHGMIDAVVHRKDLKSKLSTLFRLVSAER